VTNRLAITGSSIKGDAVAGDKHVHEAQLTPLEGAIDRIVIAYDGEEELLDIMDELAEYITDRPDREVIGLEAKLEQGDRNELYENANYLKNRFARKLAKQQVSPVAQRVYVQVLSSITNAFYHRVRPLIIDVREKAEIDAVIDVEVIQPVYRAITRFDDMATPQDVSGMLYFLTGKCHLVWSK